MPITPQGFNQQGSTPQQSITNLQQSNPIRSGSPYSRALTNAFSQRPTSFGNPTVIQKPATPPPVVHPQVQGQQVSKQVTTDATGAKQETHYVVPQGNNSGLIKGGGTSTGTSSGVIPSPDPYKTSVQASTDIGTGVTPNVNSTTAQGTEQTIASNQGSAAPVVNTQTGLLGGIAQNQTPAVTDAANRLSTLQKNDPLLMASLANNPNTLSGIAVGRNAIAGNMLAGEEQAASKAYEQALQGEGQQITAGTNAGTLATTNQGQNITAGEYAGSLANTQQSNQISALNNSAVQSHPEQLPYGVKYGTPSDLSNGSSGGGVSPTDPYYATLQNYAQQRASGQESLIPSSVTGNSVLNDQVTQMAKGINPSYNANTASANASTQVDQNRQLQVYKSAYQQGQNLQSQLGDLIKTFNLNPNDINAANTGLQAIAKNTSNPQYKMLQNYVNDVANTYSQILTPPGGSGTDTTRALSSSMLDATSKGQSLIDVMHGLDLAAQAKMAGTVTIGNDGQPIGNTNSSGGTQSNSSSGGVKYNQDGTLQAISF